MAVTRAGETIIGDFSQNCADIHHRTWLRLGFFYEHSLCYAGHPSVSLGRMNVTCQFCGAKKWLRERPGICCLSGKTSLPKLNDPPELLRSLLSGPPNVDTRHLSSIQRIVTAEFSRFVLIMFASAEAKRPCILPLQGCASQADVQFAPLLIIDVFLNQVTSVVLISLYFIHFMTIYIVIRPLIQSHL